MPDFPAKQRQKLADKGQAMPGGGFPIRNRADLQRAIQAIGRANNPDAAKAWIKKRAKELNAMDLIPESWNASHGDKPLLSDLVALEHHGIKGMKWGVRKEGTSSGGTSSFKRTAKRVGIGVLVVGGTAATAYVLSQHGSSSVSSIPKLTPKFTVTNKHGTSTYGEHAVKAFEDHVWKQSVASLSKDIAEANASQDQWMRRIGLGAVVNNAGRR